MRLTEWVASVQSDGKHGHHIGPKPDGTATDLIEAIAEHLTKGGKGIERKLLSKSMQETFFYCVGFDTRMSHSQFKTVLTRHVDRHGASSIIRLFLSLYFFNFVWFETGDSFRALAWTPGSFERHMEEVETLCQRVVHAAWKKFDETQRPLDLSAARELTLEIEHLLRGVRAGDFR
jgi:hypothetical protein